MIQFRKFQNGQRGSIIVLGPQGVLQADSFHPHWSAIVAAAESGDERVYEMFDVKAGLGRRLESLSDRIAYNGEEVTFDGTPVHSVIAEQIKRALESGEADYMPLVRFWEKLESNPNNHSKTQAYDWLACHDFKITESGDVVGYKGMTDLGGGLYESWAASRVADVPSAYVDGVPQPPLSRVQQRIGSVVTMPRDEVKANPRMACERGLHVATFAYAKSYGAVVEVHVNPRDIVSVPTDAGGAKVRVCKYTVVRVADEEAKGDSPVWRENVTATWDDVGYQPI